MSKTFVSELTPGQRIESRFAVVRKDLLPFKNPAKGSYLSMILADRTGQIDARKWENAGELYDCISGKGVVLSVRGVVENRAGRLCLNITNARVVPGEQVAPDEFLPASTRNRDEMKSELWSIIDSVSNAPLAQFLQDWFRDPDFIRRYSTAPAAKMIHHACIGGLLEHSLEVARLCALMVSWYPQADRGVLVAGAILHDVGKIEEYEWTTVIDFSDRGRLLGHTALGYDMVTQRAAETGLLTPGQAGHLGHLVLSHHGEMEQGAPVLPQTLEAAILYHSDLASGRVRQFGDVLARADESITGEDGAGGWTGYDRFLGRYLFRGFGSGGNST